MQGEKTTRFIGIDLGKRTYELKMFVEGKVNGWSGETNLQGRKKLYSRLKKTDKITIESTALAFVMEREIREAVGCEVYILNAGKLALIYGSTRKTDKEDALKLARLIKIYEVEDLPVVTPPNDQEWERRKKLSMYRGLKAQRTQCINKLHAVFEKSGITNMKKADLATANRREVAIEKLEGFEKIEAQMYLQQLNIFEKQIQQMTDMIDEEVKGDKNIELLLTIPGVGKITALAFSAYVGDTSRFSKGAQVSNYIGLVPKVDISCSIVKYGHITKKGNGYLRALLTQAAWAIVRCKSAGALQLKYKQMVLIQGKSKKKSITAISRKLAELMFTVVKNQTAYKPIYPPPVVVKNIG